MDPSIHERLVQLEKAQAERAKLESDTNRLIREIATLMKDRFKQLRSRETLATCFYVLFAVFVAVQTWDSLTTNFRINTLKKDLDKIERQLEPAKGGSDARER